MGLIVGGSTSTSNAPRFSFMYLLTFFNLFLQNLERFHLTAQVLHDVMTSV